MSLRLTSLSAACALRWSIAIVFDGLCATLGYLLGGGGEPAARDGAKSKVER